MRVAVCVERSPELLVGLLGILEVGAAYVPLDPHYPQERLRWMLEDSGACVLLTQTERLGELGPAAGTSAVARALCLEQCGGR
jgi:non-ribosomal peptide synthetase component F